MIQLIILLGIISIIDFSTKKIPVVVLVVMGIVGIAISKHRNEISAEEAVKFYEFLVSHSLIDIIGQDTMDKVIN